MSLGHGASIVRDGLVLHFDAANKKSYPGTGTVWYDLSGNNYHADYIKSDTTVHSYDATEKAMDFQGGEALGAGGLRIRDLYYTTGPDDQITNLTLECWIKCYSGTSGNVSDQRIILSFDRSAVFRWSIGGDSGTPGSNPGKPSMMMTPNGDRSATSHPDIRDDQWHHVVTTFESGVADGLKYYLDGELVHTDTATLSPISSQSESETPRYGVIGGGSEIDSPAGTSTSPDSFFYGMMAACSMYYKTFTDSEVKMNFNALRGRYGI